MNPNKNSKNNFSKPFMYKINEKTKIIKDKSLDLNSSFLILHCVKIINPITPIHTRDIIIDSIL